LAEVSQEDIERDADMLLIEATGEHLVHEEVYLVHRVEVGELLAVLLRLELVEVPELRSSDIPVLDDCFELSLLPPVGNAPVELLLPALGDLFLVLGSISAGLIFALRSFRLLVLLI